MISSWLISFSMCFDFDFIMVDSRGWASMVKVWKFIYHWVSLYQFIISIVVSLATPLWPRWGYPWPYNWNIGPIGTEQRRGWFGHLKPMAQLSLASQIWFYLVFVVLLKFPLARVVFRTLVIMFWWPTSTVTFYGADEF